jgi:hypothetical protein
MSFVFKDVSGVKSPWFQLGAGTGTGDNGKTFMYKGPVGFYIDYRNSVTGSPTIFKITDEGIDFGEFEKIIFNPEVSMDGITQIYVQDATPTSAQADDIFVDTDDYSNCDIQRLSASTTIDLDDGYSIYADGTISLTLPTVSTIFAGTMSTMTNAGVTLRVTNTGSGTVTVVAGSGNTINGASNYALAAGDSALLSINRQHTDFKVAVGSGGGGGSLPAGGSTGQIIIKQSSTEGDADWATIPVVSVDEVPDGGTIGQVLKKVSATDQDIEWADESSVDEVPDGGTTGQVLGKVSATDQDIEWVDPSGGGTGVTDHGELTGLSDDDHSQYHNDARGDARYYTQAEVDDLISDMTFSIDGGSASSVYLIAQTINGGGA